jgi:hypothetical protein
VSFVNRGQMIHGRGKHRGRKGAFGRPWGPVQESRLSPQSVKSLHQESSPGCRGHRATS